MAAYVFFHVLGPLRYLNGTVGGPVAWSTKIGEWEQLRECTNSLFTTNALIVYNQDPNGGDFLVDGVEAKEIPTLE